jgi:hypothetical protein
MTQSVEETRRRLIDFFSKELVGPAHGADETLEERPSLRYSAGVLFARECMRDESTEAGGIAEDPEASLLEEGDTGTPIEESDKDPLAVATTEDSQDDSITLANTFKPSALGISFCVDGPFQLQMTASAAVYTPILVDERKVWRREVLQLAVSKLELAGRVGFTADEITLTEGLRLRTVVRAQEGGRYLCTTSLVNDTKQGAGNARDFFQIGLSVCTTDGGSHFCDYRPALDDSTDDEERSLAMLYRKRLVFAAGHGCAADWSATTNERVAEVSTSVIPIVRVPPVVPTDTDADFANMEFLSGESSSDESIVSALRKLPASYEEWIGVRQEELAALPAEFSKSGQEHLRLWQVARRRIENGIQLLENDDHAMRSFKLMNAAMLRQQHHGRLRRELESKWEGLPTSYKSIPDKSGYWRIFQIAFVLMTLGGLVDDPDQEERNLVDLIWFPTGGGKTEAYLALSAFALFRRRIARPSNAGCTILMRYTLRLLTSQQFQRAASLICACELIRRTMPKVLGSEPFSIGLWVGETLTPNTEADAKKKLNAMSRPGEGENPFQLLACPWCGTDLTNRKRLGYVEDKKRIVFRCPANARTHGKDACPFSEPDASLPVCVVDESIYKFPPSLLIGTVDKFAMLAWRREAQPIFGGGGNSPPELIIQDELHLISGPLGSMVGLYEGAIDLLCRDESRGGPKIIASTATIRRASDQCLALFNRKSAQFPPQGLDAGDSFFARELADKDGGRIYVGFLPTAASSPLTAQIRAVSALIQGITIVRGDAEPSALDPYWTLVQYFSSLKELGRAATLVAADIPEYLPSMQRRYAVPKESKRRLVWTEEMTSRKNEAEIPKILRELERRYIGPTTDFSNRPLDTLLATSMISVGVDVDRLGLMMVVTQPKGTSEYIQASSRVGRSKQAPGLVVTLYSAGRPRDRSHYEQFRAYHDAFYRFVEPTSVTPYAIPALERGLHAVLVIVARHFAGLTNAGDFDADDPKFVEAIEFLRKRVENVDSHQLAAFDAWTDQRVKEWRNRAPRDWGGFAAPENAFLMHPMGKRPPTGEFAHYDEYWDTPTSLRSVDADCAGAVVPYPEED